MMRFPLRLSADLTRARLAQLTSHNRPLFQRLDAAEILHPNSPHPVEHKKLRATLREHRSSILWLGGGEPLDHPGVAHLVRALTKSGRLVFVETSGVALRRRIHEFQPLSNFFLVVRFDAAHLDRFALAFEGLRAARLSGFYTVALSPLTSASTLANLHELNRSLARLSIDGWLICATAENARTLAVQAQSLFGQSGWRKFSRLLERDLLAQSAHVPAPVLVPQPPRSLLASDTAATLDHNAVEESAPAS
jgi:hypothetical protein